MGCGAVALVEAVVVASQGFVDFGVIEGEGADGVVEEVDFSQ